MPCRLGNLPATAGRCQPATLPPATEWSCWQTLLRPRASRCPQSIATPVSATEEVRGLWRQLTARATGTTVVLDTRSPMVAPRSRPTLGSLPRGLPARVLAVPPNAIFKASRQERSRALQVTHHNWSPAIATQRYPLLRPSLSCVQRFHAPPVVPAPQARSRLGPGFNCMLNSFRCYLWQLLDRWRFPSDIRSPLHVTQVFNLNRCICSAQRHLLSSVHPFFSHLCLVVSLFQLAPVSSA